MIFMKCDILNMGLTLIIYGIFFMLGFRGVTHAGAIKKYFVKIYKKSIKPKKKINNKSSISRKPEKAT